MFQVAQFSSLWWSEAFGPETQTYFESVDSTQTQAREHMTSECSNHGHLFVANTQTSGKGRGENTWDSPPADTSFMASILQRMPSPPQPILTPLFGWAVYKALNEAFPGNNFSIKAPNDIYLNDKKVAGLLLDSMSQGSDNWVVFGLGINVFSSPDLEISTSLEEEGVNVTEEAWEIFLRTLSSDLTVANQMSLNKEIKAQYIKVIVKGLKNWSGNYIKNITPTGDIILEDETVVSWRNL